jgi:hypothetical protein
MGFAPIGLDMPYRVFISEDPIGLAGGDVNFFAYAWNSPINWVDPWGLEGVTPIRPSLQYPVMNGGGAVGSAGVITANGGVIRGIPANQIGGFSGVAPYNRGGGIPQEVPDLPFETPPPQLKSESPPKPLPGPGTSTTSGCHPSK